MKQLAFAAIVLAATAAHANVWKQAIDTGAPDPKQDIYDSEMKSGDELALQAIGHTASRENVRQLVNHAALSYRNAASAKPDEGEPYFRLGRLLYSFYFECGDTALMRMNPSPLCDPQSFDRKRAEEVIDAWDAFEARAPLDPRLSVIHDENNTVESEVLFHRAVLHTRLVTKAHLEAATRDYEKILARADVPDETVLSNLAETYMMLGKLDQAIDTYREALRTSRHTETLYGLAVALDRDERSGQARDLILSQGESSMDEFHDRVMTGTTFFVPIGEEYYYFALAYEAFGKTEDAIEYWQKYIESGAHPEFQPRAHAHLDPLLAARKRKSIHIEPPWHELFH